MILEDKEKSLSFLKKTIEQIENDEIDVIVISTLSKENHSYFWSGNSISSLGLVSILKKRISKYISNGLDRA